MYSHRVISLCVVGHKEGPASSIAIVLIATMQQVAMKEQSISRIQLNINKRKNLDRNKIKYESVSDFPCIRKSP